MSQSQDKNKPGAQIARKAEVAETANTTETASAFETAGAFETASAFETAGVAETAEIQGAVNDKWYQNNWFILTVSIVMIALLVFSVFLSHQWGTIERTIFGNKAFYYKMEMDNFSDIAGRFTSTVDYSYETKTNTTGTVQIDNIGSDSSGALGLLSASLNDLSLNFSYQNDDEEKVSKAELDLCKNSVDKANTTSPIAQVDLFLNNNGVFAEFPHSGYATALYDVNENLSRRIFAADWMDAINNSEVSWAVYDVLQEVNNVIPDNKVFHYDEVEFDGWEAHKIEFILDASTQLNIKNALLRSISKKEIKQVLSDVEESLEENLMKNDASESKSGTKNKKKTKERDALYKWLKNYIEKIPCDRGEIVYNVIYDNDQNILSREVVLPDNRIQILSYMEGDALVLGFFNEKTGINIENKCTFNNGAKGIEGRLIIDSGSDELGVIYQCSGIIGGVIPVGKFEVVAGKTGVAETDAGAVPIWKANLNVQKEDEKVFVNFAYEKNQKQVISVTGDFIVDDLKNKIDKVSSDRAEKSKSISELSTEKMLAEVVWNYTLLR